MGGKAFHTTGRGFIGKADDSAEWLKRGEIPTMATHPVAVES